MPKIERVLILSNNVDHPTRNVRIEGNGKIIVGELGWSDKFGEPTFFLTHIITASHAIRMNEAIIDSVSFDPVQDYLVVHRIFGLDDCDINTQPRLGNRTFRNQVTTTSSGETKPV